MTKIYDDKGYEIDSDYGGTKPIPITGKSNQDSLWNNYTGINTTNVKAKNPIVEDSRPYEHGKLPQFKPNIEAIKHRQVRQDALAEAQKILDKPKLPETKYPFSGATVPYLNKKAQKRRNRWLMLD